MNILIPADRLIYGGGEKVRNWLSSQLCTNGINVFYLTSCLNSKYNEDLERVGLFKKVNIIEYDYSLKKRNIYRYIKSIKNIYQKYQIDLFLIFGGSLIEQIVAKNSKVKILLSERGNPKSRSFLSQLLKKIQYRFADGFVFQTVEASKYYNKRAQKLSIIIPNPIIDRLPDPILTSRKEIVTVGRLSYEKNQKILIDAFALFNKKHKDYKLLIYGSGPLYNDLNYKIHEYNLSDDIHIIRGKQKLVDLINGAELFVLTSNTEGMPNALIEAMSMGLQCISTDCPIYGPRMLIKDGVNGYLVPMNNVQALYEKMCYVVEHPHQADIIRQNAIKIRVRLNEIKIASLWITYINNMFVNK